MTLDPNDEIDDSMAANPEEPIDARADAGYAPPPVSVRAGVCRKCGEKPRDGVLHGMGDRPERVYCGPCVGDFNWRRTRR